MIKHKFFLLIVYLLFFIALSGKLTIEIFVIGLLVSMVVLFINTDRKKHIAGIGSFSIKKMIFFIQFAILLVKEIIVSNFSVALILVKPRIVVNPCVVRYKTKLKSSYYRAVFANSITLTPGTLTVDLNKNELTVHCLSRGFALGLLDSKLEKLLVKLEE